MPKRYLRSMAVPENALQGYLNQITESMKGIMFTEPLFNAVIEGRKTQTRRLYKGRKLPDSLRDITSGYSTFTPENHIAIRGFYNKIGDPEEASYGEWWIKPRYKKGETLYMKEPYFPVLTEKGDGYLYKFDKGTIPDYLDKWKNKMFMPESAARYFIEVTGVGVERVQDISDIDAINEGIEQSEFSDHYRDYDGWGWTRSERISFETLWNSINKKEGTTWEDNPYVWAYEFKLKDA